MPALKRALALPRAEEGMSRTVIIATDGYVRVEPEVFELIRNKLGDANMFAFGIGKSVNRHIIEGMAHVGMGEPFVMSSQTEAQKQAVRFREMIASPVLTRIRV
ncbi:MAG: trypsin, partial [bacterium]